jgi:hypothetical protein
MEETDIFIDSARRNVATNPNANSYVVHLKTALRCVKEVELVSAILPRLTYDKNVILDIQEFRNDKLKGVYNLNQFYLNANSIVTSPGESITRCFGVIPVIGTTINSNVLYTPSTTYSVKTYFKTPIDVVDRITITWKDENGNTLYTGENSILLRVKHVS